MNCLHCHSADGEHWCAQKVNVMLRREEKSDSCELRDREYFFVASFEDAVEDSRQPFPDHLEFRLREILQCTGGRSWRSAHQLASFIFAHRGMLVGKSVLELACGLGIPSLVASNFAAKVVASDINRLVLQNVRSAAQQISPAAAQSLSVRRLDFATASGMSEAGLGCWDVVLFAECTYSHQLGAALPHAVSALLKPGGMSLGAFPVEERIGLADFWAEVPRAGLAWQKPGCWPEPGQDGGCRTERQGQIYVFWKEGGGDAQGDVESEAESVASLFHDL